MIASPTTNATAVAAPISYHVNGMIGIAPSPVIWSLIALISLGFSAKDSDDAINSVLSDISQEEIAKMELGELLKLALQSGKK